MFRLASQVIELGSMKNCSNGISSNDDIIKPALDALNAQFRANAVAMTISVTCNDKTTRALLDGRLLYTR